MAKYTAKQYALALFESLDGVAETNQAGVFKNFTAILLANNDRALLPKIYQYLERIRRQKTGRHDVVLTTAKKAPVQLLEEINSKLGGKADIEEVVDVNLGGGAKMVIDGEYLIDGSFKGRVEKLFQQVLVSGK